MEETSNRPRNLQELAVAIRKGQALIESMLHSLTPVEMEEIPAGGGWSVKDHVAHLNGWRSWLLAKLQGRPGYEGLGLEEASVRGTDIDGINALMYQKSRNLPLAEVVNQYRALTDAIAAQLQKMTDDDLFKLMRPNDPNSKETMLDWIAGNTYEHDEEHQGWIGAMLRERAQHKSEG